MHFRDLYYALVIISFLASLTVYFQKNVQSFLRLFPVFLLLTILVEVMATWMYSSRHSPTLVYNIWSTLEFLFYMYVLGEIIRSVRMKRMIFYVGSLYALLGVANILFLQKLASYNSLTYALGCLLISLICIYYFFELFQSTDSVSLLRHPAFWISAGLLFYYTCSFPIFGLINFLNKAPAIIQKNLEVILVFLNVFLYSSFTIAFLCRIKGRNSTS